MKLFSVPKLRKKTTKPNLKKPGHPKRQYRPVGWLWTVHTGPLNEKNKTQWSIPATRCPICIESPIFKSPISIFETSCNFFVRKNSWILFGDIWEGLWTTQKYDVTLWGWKIQAVFDHSKFLSRPKKVPSESHNCSWGSCQSQQSSPCNRNNQKMG